MGYIVTVEDEEGIRNNIVEILELEDFKTIGFPSPVDFIEHIKKNGIDEIDLIITDIMMPVMTGIEMIKRTGTSDSLINIPVIYLTALGDQHTIEGAYDTCHYVLTVDYIIKPFQTSWFIAKIRTMVALKKKNSELRLANEEIMKTNLEIRDILDKIDSENHYLVDRLKSILSKTNMEIDKKLSVVKELMPKIAVNDLASLKFVAEIIERNRNVIEKIIREPTEEDEFFKILPKTAEPLRTAIWDIEQTIKLFISLGIVEQDSIDKIKFEETSFYEILLNNYKQGGFSTEQFQLFLEDTKFNRKRDDSDIILF